jgi:hypothetical protein
VDYKNPTSVYVNISAWGKPTDEFGEQHQRTINLLRKDIKKYVYNNLPINFNKLKTIIDLDMRESGIMYGKKSYMSCEITLYQKNTPTLKPIRTTNLKKILGDIVDDLIENVFEPYDGFKFYKRKDN